MLSQLIEREDITADVPIEVGQIQPSSLDLRLGSIAYRVRASFLPGAESTVQRKIEEQKFHEIDLSRRAVLEKGCVYIVPLKESLNLPNLVSGKANPKSSTGRLDIFTRLITDYGGQFDNVSAGYKGRLYAEIVPRTFSVLLGEGARLNQLRLTRGDPQSSYKRLTDLNEDEALVYAQDESPTEATYRKQHLRIHVELGDVGSSAVIGYRAKKHAPLIDLDRVNFYDTTEFWDPIFRSRNRDLILDPEEFYILASKEKVRIPPTDAAEMSPYDPFVGEFRIHYAGFFDPGFGHGTEDIKGTRAVLEVRSHGVPFLLEDGQEVCGLVFERLMAVPDKLYGQSIGSNYQHQGLALSKQFKRFLP